MSYLPSDSQLLVLLCLTYNNLYNSWFYLGYMSKIENAIEKVKGACVIFAGAGTGKTRAIVEKIKYLIEKEVCKPERIVCLTFSNEAANQLLVRVRESIKLGEEEPSIRTFHGFSSDLLKKYGGKIGIGEGFKIIDTDEAKVILHRFLNITPVLCHSYISAIGNAKDLGISIESVREYVKNEIKKLGISEDRVEERMRELEFQSHTLHLKKDKSGKEGIVDELLGVRRIRQMQKFVCAWGAYEKLKEKNNYQDYSDLNQRALCLLKSFSEIANEFDYIIVDEFQDTNKVQLELLFALAKKGNINVVGDMNQSIYRFRGAYQRNISEFKKHFNVGENEMFFLEKSYRSPNSVLRVAHRLIKNNYCGREDECFFVENALGKEGEKIMAYEMENGKEEARKIAEIVEGEIKNGKKASEICVLFRAHQNGKLIKMALESKGIPYCSVSKQSLFKQPSVKSVINYLRILDKLAKEENGGEEPWWNLMHSLSFSEDELIRIGQFIKEKNKGDEILSLRIINGLEKLELSDKGKIIVKGVIERINELRKLSGRSVEEIVQEIYRRVGLVSLEVESEEEREIMMNLSKFYELAKHHSEIYENSLAGFVYYLEILERLGIETDAAEIETDGVRLMTLHATKGLEFKSVIVSNMAEKRFPVVKYYNNSLVPLELLPELEHLRGEEEYVISEYERKHQLLEERRLCYVAFTRAKENLFLTYASEYGGKRFYPSSFLAEINYKNNDDIVFEIDNGEKWDEMVRVDEGSSEKKESKEKEKIEKKVFSPSALLLFDKCQKEFEYKYVYNMPELKGVSWEALRLGSFVHNVLEESVKSGFGDARQFKELARAMHLSEDWESVELDDALVMIDVFFERHRNRYSSKSKTECVLDMEISGLKFHGFADRIDFTPFGLEIIDYKTGKGVVFPRDRNWQLGYYALAASKFGKVNKVILEMLRQEKPLEFVLDDNGNARAVHEGSRMSFNIYEVKEELVKTANAIKEAYKTGFKPCPADKGCEFCNEYVYGN